MIVEDLLISTAEISVAFTGFAGVVGAFWARSDRSEAASYRLRQMILTSLSTLAMALAPLSMLALGLHPAVAWRTASGAYAAATLIFTTRSIVEGRAFFPTSGWFTLMAGVGSLIAVAAAIVNAAGFIPEDRLGGVYLACVWWLLALSGSFFVRLFGALHR